MPYELDYMGLDDITPRGNLTTGFSLRIKVAAWLRRRTLDLMIVGSIPAVGALKNDDPRMRMGPMRI